MGCASLIPILPVEPLPLFFFVKLVAFFGFVLLILRGFKP